MQPDRSYQLVAADAVRAHWRAGRRRVVLTAGVGAGKTRIFEYLALPILAADSAQVVFVAHTDQLIDQPARRFSDIGIQSAFVKAGRRRDGDAAVQFCSGATLVNHPIQPSRRRDGSLHTRVVVFIDEAHRARSATIESILVALNRTFTFVYICYLTATPYRLDGRGFAEIADALVEAVTPRRLVEAGVILDPVYALAPARQRDEDSAEDDEALFRRPAVVGNLVAEYLKRGRDDDGFLMPAIGRAVSIAHSRDVVERYNRAEVTLEPGRLSRRLRAAHIDGTMSAATKRRLLARLTIGGGRGADHPLALDALWAGSPIFDEGFDSRLSWEAMLPATDDGRAALALLDDTAVELGPAEARALTERVVASVLPELRDFYGGDAARWGGVGGGVGGAASPHLPHYRPPPYQPLAVLIDAAPTASVGAWMQRQGRVVRAWPGDDNSTAKTKAVVISHGGNERHGYLIHHSSETMPWLFALGEDARWAPKIKASLVAQMKAQQPTRCPSCLCVDRPGVEVCRWCGAAIPTSRLPDESETVGLVEASTAVPIAVSTPGTREAFLRKQYARQAAANKARRGSGLPPYKPGWAAMRFRSRFGFWPDGRLDRMLRREFGIE